MATPVFTVGQVLTASDVNVWLQPLAVVKAATESITTSTALQNDDELFLSVAANSDYAFICNVRYDGSVAGDFKWQWTIPASATLTYKATYEAGGGGNAGAIVSLDNSVPWNASTFGTGTTQTVTMQGLLQVAGTAGTFRLQWAQNTSDATATRVIARSYIVLQRVA